MGFNKNFVVKNGLEVGTNLIVADPTTLSVGIGTTVPQYTLHTLGGIGATFATITGVGTIGNIVLSGGVSAGSSQGVAGQYLVRSGNGVTWQSFPTTRTTSTQTATAAQTLFVFAYIVGLLDVYVNGVKLTAAEFVATDGASITIIQPCFGGETVEFIAYSTTSAGVGYTGINGITVQNAGITTGNGLSITSINFTGAGVAVAGSGAGVTVTIAGGGGGSGTNYWSETAAGINTLSNVGIGTTNPRFALEVGAVGASGTSLLVNGNARITGILTIGTSSITLNGNTDTLTVPNLSISGVTTIATLNVGTGGTVITTTAAGRVGIGTTNPTSKLTVTGNSSFVGVLTVGGISIPGQINVVDSSSDSTRLSPGAIAFNGNGNIQQIGDTQYFRAGENGNSSYYFSNYYSGFNHELFFIDTNGGIRVSGNANIVGFTTTARLNVGTGGTVITTNSGGKVGIGTTNPGYADHVNADNSPANLPSASLTVGSVGTSNTSFVVNGKAFINGIHIHTGLSPSPQNNAFFGWRAGMLSASGGLNAAFGAGALTTPSGAWCAAFGNGALAIATGNENSAFGSSAGTSLTNGTNNTLIGRSSGVYLSSGSNNTLVGYQAGGGSLNASTNSNTYLGYNSGVSMSTGSSNTIIGTFTGSQDGLDIRSSSYNVVLSDGSGAVRFYANSSGNVGIGTTNPTSALTVGAVGSATTNLVVNGFAKIDQIVVKNNSNSYQDNIIMTQHPAGTFTGGRNVAIGDYSFTTPGAANENVAIGYYALNVLGNNDTLNVQSGNTALGCFSGQSSTITLRNTLIGYKSGQFITTGDTNTILGAYDGNQNGLDIRTSDGNVVLSDGDGNVRFYANSSGNVGIGTTNPTEALQVGGNARVGINTSQGVILTSPDGTKYRLFVENGGTLKTIAV